MTNPTPDPTFEGLLDELERTARCTFIDYETDAEYRAAQTAARSALLRYVEELKAQHEAENAKIEGIKRQWERHEIAMQTEIVQLREQVRYVEERTLTAEEADILIASTEGLPEELNDKLIDIVECKRKQT